MAEQLGIDEGAEADDDLDEDDEDDIDLDEIDQDFAALAKNSAAK